MRLDNNENVDQRALRLWLTAGLAIPEVAAFYGDAAYLINNMIAKYTLAADSYAISKGALYQFQSDGINISKTYSRRTFYGKQGGFIYEHAVPAGVVREVLCCGDKSTDTVRAVLRAAGTVAVLLRTENDCLNAAGLSRKMPEGWIWGDDSLARYKAVDIELSGKVLRVSGAICR